MIGCSPTGFLRRSRGAGGRCEVGAILVAEPDQGVSHRPNTVGDDAPKGLPTDIWCRYLCPVSGVFRLLAKLALVYYRVDRAQWEHCPPHIGRTLRVTWPAARRWLPPRLGG